MRTIVVRTDYAFLSTKVQGREFSISTNFRSVEINLSEAFDLRFQRFCRILSAR